jgi:hypothetical protein
VLWVLLPAAAAAGYFLGRRRMRALLAVISTRIIDQALDALSDVFGEETC